MMQSKTMNYPVPVVTARLEANRTKHVEQYKAATEGFHKKRAELYDDLARLLSTAIDPTDCKEIDARYTAVYKLKQTIDCLPRPESHEDDYDRALDMLKCCSETDVEMDGDTFDKYMRDQWKWMQAFTAATKSYVDRLPG